MTHEPQHFQPLFHVDVSSDSQYSRPEGGTTEVIHLLQDLVEGQDRQNQLLEELVSQLGNNQKQRQHELGQWRKANPRLARECREAAETLSQVQTEFLQSLIEEVNDTSDSLLEGEFMLNEFVDRFGPRLSHLNGVLQVLSQLGSVSNPATEAHDESN